MFVSRTLGVVALLVAAGLSVSRLLHAQPPPPPPPGTIVVDQVTFSFTRTPDNNIPGDGLANSPTVTCINWHSQGGSPPPGATLTIVWDMFFGPGQLTPASAVVPVQSNPILINTVVYTQPEMPTATDELLIGRATCQGKEGRASTYLRGVSLQLFKFFQKGADELYSGTQTGRACCDVCVRAWCPNGSQYCKPSGKILATVAGEGVWLKWGEGGGWAWGKNREETLADGSIPTTPPILNVRRACFTVATDKPGGLPHDPETAYFDCQLKTADSPVTGHEDAAVLVPQELVHPEPAGGETPVVHQSQEFTGNLTWYAEPNETKYYWGASGTVHWTLPQGECQEAYRQNTDPPQSAYPYRSAQTTQNGEGNRSLTEEHDFEVTVPVKVHDNPQNWLQWACGLWREKYTTVDIIVGALALTAKLLTGE